MTKLLKYQRHTFLPSAIAQGVYERWLRRKAAAHAKRDRRRGSAKAIGEAYRLAIHQAVVASDGKDAYTGEKLDWTLISRYDNAESKEKSRSYKHTFAHLPTVDHVGDGLGVADFKICGWRTNDAKNDLSLEEFIALCRRVVEKASG